MRERSEWEALAEKYMDTVYRVALNALRQPADAEDVTQEVLLRLLKSDTAFTDGEHAKRWLIRVTVNECRRLQGSPWRKCRGELSAEAAAPEADEQQRALLEAVLRLPAKYRLPMYLYYYEGYSVEEVGRLLERNPSTVQTQLARGREQLRRSLREE
ncbi:MAG: RNA polymerase sigma factor [Oscillospiraceae bacterium]